MSNYRLSLRQRWWKTKGTSWPSCWWTWWRGRSRERKIFRFDFLSFFQSFAECCLTEDDGGDGDDTGGGARELLVDPISEAPRQQTQGAWGGRGQDGREGETLTTMMAIFYNNIHLLPGETTSCGLWCRGACACLCQEEGEKCNQCHRGCTSKSSRLSPKKSYSTADQYFASR